MTSKVSYLLYMQSILMTSQSPQYRESIVVSSQSPNAHRLKGPKSIHLAYVNQAWVRLCVAIYCGFFFSL
jgi:hypothetical protein